MYARILGASFAAACLCSTLAFAAQDVRRTDPVAVAAHRFAAGALESVRGLPHNPAAVLVRFPDDVGEGYKRAVRAMVGDGSFQRPEADLGIELVTIRVPVQRALERLAPFVEFVERDAVLKGAQQLDDPLLPQLWGMRNTGQSANGDPGVAGVDIRADEAWAAGDGAAEASIAVAVIDTGVDRSHPDLAANIWSNPDEVEGNGVDDDGNGYVDDVHGWDFYGRDNDSSDENGHGTHVAGTIGAAGGNGIGVVGVLRRCRIVPLRFIGPQGGFVSDAVAAVDYCRVKGVKVSNNSWGGGGYSQALYDAIANARAAGHVFVAAAGNSGLNTDSQRAYPAAYDLDNIVSVAAANNDGLRASFSNYGVQSVDLAAPGVAILSTWPGGGYQWLQGTSMACPHVAGAVALVYARNPSWSVGQVRGRVLAAVRALPAWKGVVATGGLLDVGNAATASRLLNTAPKLVLSAPRANVSVVVGSPVACAAVATDREDGDLSARIAWSSNLQGALGEGPFLSACDLVVGKHTLSASVVDAGGLQTTVVRLLTVRPPPPPLAPSMFTARWTAPGSALLAWIDRSSDESAFEVERQQRVGSVWTAAQSTLLPGGTVSVPVAPGAGIWRWRVRAVGTNGASAWSVWKQLVL